MGIAAGVGGALALARFMTTLVFGIPARDPVTFTIVPVLLAMVAIVTALIPARRAARIDPITSLRDI
jgi:ABC-type antimicrobial peptide transport system permease subunit